MKKSLVFIAVSLMFSTGFSQEKISFEKAMNIAVENNYEIQIQKAALLAANGELNKALGNLDFKFGLGTSFAQEYNPYDSRDAHNYQTYGRYQKSQIVQSTISAEKLFSFGLNTKLSYTIKRENIHYDGSYYDELYRGARNNGHVALELSLPLFKSFNDSLVAKQLDSARAYYDQMSYQLNDKIAQTVIQIADSYWNYFLAYDKLQQLKELNNRIESRNKNIQRLINAGARSKNDLLGMEINKIENQRNIINAETELISAKTKLMIAMGISNENLISEPDYKFPKIDHNNLNIPKPAEFTDELISSYASTRPDIQALQKGVEMAKSNYRAAKIDLRPDANLHFSIGTAGTQYYNTFQSYVDSPFHRVYGANVSGDISIEAKLGNREKKGSIEKAAAELQTAELKLAQAQNTIRFQIRSSLYTLNQNLITVTDAEDVLKKQKTLYENEQKRFNAGLITLDNLIDQDTKFLNSQNEYYRILINYLQSILNFKYNSGEFYSIVSEDLSKSALYSTEYKNEPIPEVSDEAKNDE